ncbi:hypothetical protein EXIGLDRAFT_608524 [Exidia glandulosa HHB12029]|uniref:Snf7-domain-containing protein n=1 Tax=Exidia glandulosa HHB12029 TaxID=1314781 RepID=A0A165KX28_EXIGL|nr:hypothetical protein EXIGLDRAFT_608524 [Exidia glandulosa HHB12029]
MSDRAAATSAYLASLPEFKSAPRVAALYSDISRKKQSDPASYNSTVAWWQRTLQDLVARGLQGESSDKLVLHVDSDLLESLRWQKAGKPLSLGCAIGETRGAPPDLIPLGMFMDARQSIYTPSSLVYRVAATMVVRPILWALEQFSIVGGEESRGADAIWKSVRGDYVVLPNLEKAADAVIARQAEKPQISLASSLYSLHSFRTEFADCALPGVTLSDTDIKVLIRYLSRDKRCIVADKEVVKFVEVDSTATSITEVDRGVLEMQMAVERLETQVEDIRKQIAQRTERIATALRAAQKTLAMSYLRSRKQLEDLLSKRLGALDTLQSQLSAIERAVGDAEIMQAYETSARTLRTALQNPLLQRERVDATLDDMAEALADQREIDDAIRAGEAGVVDADEDELAKELAGLVDEVQREEKSKTEHEEKEEARKSEEELIERLAKLRTPTEAEEAEKRLEGQKAVVAS